MLHKIKHDLKKQNLSESDIYKNIITEMKDKMTSGTVNILDSEK